MSQCYSDIFVNLPELGSSNRARPDLRASLSALDPIDALAPMASNSRYTARFLERDLEHDEDEYEDDPDYVMDVEEGERDIAMEDVEPGGSGHDGEGSDEDNEGEDGDDPEDQPARVITLDELREWTDAGTFLAVKSSVKLSTL